MNFNIEVRRKQLESLDQYITSSKDRVESVLGYLGWNAKKVLQGTEKTVCPLDKGHTVPLEKLVKHVDKCRILSSGYTLHEPCLSEPQYHPKYSIVLDQQEKIHILNEARLRNPRFRPAWNGHEPDPMTSDRLTSTYSSDERLALYDHCISNTEPLPIPPEFNININDKKENRELTKEERLKQERNARRRRVKYRSVHTGRNKSYTEVMKEVIDNQMELYQEYVATQMEQKQETAESLCNETTENLPDIDTSLQQQYLYNSNDSPRTEYPQAQIELQQYYDDQYDKYIPTDYFSNTQNIEMSLTSSTTQLNNSNYYANDQIPVEQQNFSTCYDASVKENLKTEVPLTTETHSFYSENSYTAEKQFLDKSNHDKSFSNNRRHSNRHSTERERESYSRRDNNDSSRERYHKEYRSKDYDRRSNHGRERFRVSLKEDYPKSNSYKQRASSRDRMRRDSSRDKLREGYSRREEKKDRYNHDYRNGHDRGGDSRSTHKYERRH